MVLLTVAGLHVPVILLVDVDGSIGAVAPEQIGAIASNVGVLFGLTVTFVVQVAELPHASVTVQFIVDIPTLKLPLASLPEPLLFVAPVIWYVMVVDPLQLSDAINVGIV